MADYLFGEILSGLPTDMHFLRVSSICDPVPVGLATELSGRDEAGRILLASGDVHDRVPAMPGYEG